MLSVKGDRVHCRLMGTCGCCQLKGTGGCYQLMGRGCCKIKGAGC